MSTTQVLLVRHGETAWNRQHRYVGRTDLPLSERGIRQAERLAQRLAGEPIEAIYSSDLQRASQTAERIAAVHGLTVHFEPCLREADFGAWEGLTLAEIHQSYPREYAAWLADPSVPAPAGESIAQVAARVGPFLRGLVAQHPAGAIAVVGHGGSLHALIFMALQFQPRNGWTFYMDNGSVSELLLREDGAALVRLNDTHPTPPPDLT